MPIYEYQCPSCQHKTSKFQHGYDPPDAAACEACGQEGAPRILSTFAVHKDTATKMAELDPRYDKMVDDAISKASPDSDPRHHLDKMIPFDAAEE
ncbi:MAG: zinc ribbon domain-containing protein [Dehalococcoidia bacterium]